MNLKQHAFVNEYLYWNDATIAYKNAYNSKSSNKTIESAGNRLLKNPEVAAAIERSLSAVRSRVENEVAQRLKVELLTIQEKRTILAQIARGDMYIEHHYKGKGCAQCTQYLKPTYNLMLRAIQEDSRLAGHYPDKRIHKHNNSQQNLVSTTGKLANQNEQVNTQQNEHCPPHAGAAGNEPGVDTREENQTQQKPVNTITHAGLRKLFAKMEQQPKTEQKRRFEIQKE